MKEAIFRGAVTLLMALSCGICAVPLHADSGRVLFSFGVFADAQYVDAPNGGNRCYRASIAKVEECVARFNAEKPAFVVQMGDLIDHDGASFSPMLDRYNKLSMPHYNVLGNHDFARVSAEEVVRHLGLKRRYYDFAKGSWKFVVLDGNDVSLQSSVGNAEKTAEAQAMLQKQKGLHAPNAQSYNGGVGPAQLAWLKAKLNAASKSHQNVVIFCHMPVFPYGGDCNLWNDEELVKTIESYPCVKVWINGHDHKGNYAVKDGVHYVTLQGMVDTPDTNAFALVRVYQDRLVIVGSGRIPSIALALR